MIEDGFDVNDSLKFKYRYISLRNNKYQEIINKVYEECFKEETLLDRKYLHKCNTFKQGIHTRNKRKI